MIFASALNVPLSRLRAPALLLLAAYALQGCSDGAPAGEHAAHPSAGGAGSGGKGGRAGQTSEGGEAGASGGTTARGGSGGKGGSTGQSGGRGGKASTGGSGGSGADQGGAGADGGAAAGGSPGVGGLWEVGGSSGSDSLGGAGLGGEAGDSGAPGVGGVLGLGGAGVGGGSGAGASSGTGGDGVAGTGGTAGDGVGGSSTGGTAGDGASGGSSGGTAGTGGVAGTGGDGVGGVGGGAGIGGVGGAAGIGGVGGVSGDGAGGAAAGGVGGSGGAVCSDTPVTLATSAQAWGLALRGGYAYYTTHELHGSVLRVPTSGGAPSVISSDELYPHDVTANDELVFWSTAGDVPGILYSAGFDGSGREERAIGPSDDFQGIFNLSADENNVYYTSNMNDMMELPLSGAWGSEVKLALGPYNSMIVDAVLFAGDLYWTNHGVGTFAPWASQSGAVMRGDVTMVNAPYALVNRLDYPQWAIAVDEDGVFWSDETAIYRTSRDGGSFTSFVTLLPAPADVSPVVDMVSDGVDLFFADRHAVYRVPVAGGDPELVTDGWSRITHMAQDADSIYFTDPNLGVVIKVAKCASAAPSGGSGGSGGGGTGGIEAGDVTTATPVVPATGAWGLATDESYLYFSTFGTPGMIQRVPLAGGDPETVVSNETKVHDIAVDATSVYFCLADTASGHLAKAPKAGGARVPLASGAYNYGVGRVASDGAFAYYITSYNIVYRVPTQGGTPAMVGVGPFNSTASDLAIDDGRLFWVNDGIYNSGFTARLPGTAFVGEAPVSGTEDFGRDDVLGGIDAPNRITVDDSNVYFVAGTTLYSRKKTGGPVTSLGTTPTSSTLVDLLSDGQFVYLADAHAVYRTPVSGGATQTMVSGATAIRALAADATQIYFTDNSGGSVMKFPK